MSSTTTLEGFFFDDDQNCQARLLEAIAKGHFKTACEVRLGFQLAAAGSFPDVVKKKLERLSSEGVVPLLNDLKEAFITSYSPDAAGNIRLRVYEAGRSADMAVSFTRKIGQGGSGSDVLTIAVLDRLLNRTAVLEQQSTENLRTLVAALHEQSVLLAENNKSLSTIATQRAVTTSAADAQGINGILALGALVLFWAPIRKALALPEGASPAQLMALTQKKLELAAEAWQREFEDGPGKDPDTPVRTAEDLRQQAEVPPAGALPPVEDLVNTIKADPDYLAKLKGYLNKHPEVLL